MPEQQPRPTPPSLAGRCLLAFIGLSTAAIGAVFVWLLAQSFLNAKAMRSWPQASCTVLLSTLEEKQHDPHSPLEYRHSILYGYEFKGQNHTSSLLSLRGNPWSKHRPDIEKRIAALPVGTRTTCFISPTPPHTAVLKPDSLAPGYSIWFPSLFVLGGLVMAFRAIKPRFLPRIRPVPRSPQTFQ
jgi:Protein of unknown function (DUF3592)